MHKRIPIKNHHKEIQLIVKRGMLALVIIFILVGLLITRLAYLQIYKSDVYATLSKQNWLDLIPVEPTRGLIFDRNGVLLAENVPVFSLDIIPFQVPDLSKTLNALNKIVALTPSEISQFQKQLKQGRRFDEIPLKLRLTEQEVALFSENQHRLPGVFIKARLMRHYPHGEIFSHVIGYVGRINAQELTTIDQTNYSASHYIGKLGIEKFYEEALHGKVGYEQVEIDASGKPIRVLHEIKGTPGKNIYLTLDSGLQLYARKALQGKRGAIVAIDPANGQVLAMVSNPGYDPNIFVAGISQKDYNALRQSEDRPLYDRALRGLYPPASTIKPFLSLQGLNTGIITTDYTISDQGFFQFRPTSHKFHDWIRNGHGKVNVHKALVSSCDTFFYDLGSKMGIDLMSDILTQFGFGGLTGIDLDGELLGVVPSPQWKRKAKKLNWYEGDTVLSSIGQGFMQATPLQLAVATVSLANRGQRYVPYLHLGEEIPGQSLSLQSPTPLEPINLNNNRHWETVIHAMQGVISQGTAQKFFGKNFSYTVAAKTGTGQLSRRRNPDEMDKQENLPERLRDHHLFIAFAPVDKPLIALAVVTENSNTAVETARLIFDYYLGKKENVNRPTQIQAEKTTA